MVLQWKSWRKIISLEQHIVGHTLFESPFPQLSVGHFVLRQKSIFRAVEQEYNAYRYISRMVSGKHVIAFFAPGQHILGHTLLESPFYQPSTDYFCRSQKPFVRSVELKLCGERNILYYLPIPKSMHLRRWCISICISCR